MTVVVITSYCTSCGKRHTSGETHCAACGADLSKDEPEYDHTAERKTPMWQWAALVVLIIIVVVLIVLFAAGVF
jgi:uncharacterized membrane protein YvbJ